MTERDFCYWLQGFIELSDAKSLSEDQIKMVKDHLALVFNKVTPMYPSITVPSPLTAPWKPFDTGDITITCKSTSGEAGVTTGTPITSIGMPSSATYVSKGEIPGTFIYDLTTSGRLMTSEHSMPIPVPLASLSTPTSDITAYLGTGSGAVC